VSHLTATGAAQLSRTQYKEGAVNFLDVIDADRTVLQSQRAAAQLFELDRNASREYLFRAISLLRAQTRRDTDGPAVMARGRGKSSV
jgi:outer membrane protein TolC